jgi:hypothetical protein
VTFNCNHEWCPALAGRACLLGVNSPASAATTDGLAVQMRMLHEHVIARIALAARGEAEAADAEAEEDVNQRHAGQCGCSIWWTRVRTPHRGLPAVPFAAARASGTSGSGAHIGGSLPRAVCQKAST